MKRTLEEIEERDNVEMAPDSDSSGLFPDPAISCIRSLDAARESATLIMEQVQRGRIREGTLQQQLRDAEEARDVSRDQLKEAEDTVLTLRAKLKCSEAARDVLERHQKEVVAAKKGSRETVPEMQPASATPTAGVPHAERVAMRQLVENLVISKTAEALRRREAEKLTIGVTVYGAVLKGVISDPMRECTCHQDAEKALFTVTPLPRQEDSRDLHAAILQILDTMRVEGTVDLHDYSLVRYDQNEEEDRREVEKAQAEGRNNPSARQVLVTNACQYPQQTAERKIKESCPSLAISPPPNYQFSQSSA